MSMCSRLLDPIFQEIAIIEVKKSHLNNGSNAWKRLDCQAELLYSDARRIFLQFNPDFRKKEDEDTTVNEEMKSPRRNMETVDAREEAPDQASNTFTNHLFKERKRK